MEEVFGGMSDEGGNNKELECAIDESVQDVYNVYRPTIGDHKMDSHPWKWRKERHAAFAAWLRALADRVEGEGR